MNKNHPKTFPMLWYSILTFGVFEGSIWLFGLHPGLAVAAFLSVACYLYKDF